MRARFFTIVMLVLATSSYATLVGRSNLGLYGALCENMATFDMPTTANRVYADLLGTNTLYYTDNRGVTWVPAISGEDLYGIATDSTYVYANVENEIWRSLGGDGITWTPILTFATPVYTNEMFTSIQHDGTRLMVGCEGGVAYFNPTGDPTAWSQHVINPLAGMNTAVTCITSRPSDPNTILAVINARDHPTPSANELHVSTDGGMTWSPVVLPPTIARSIEVVGVDPTHPDHVYLAGDSAWATIYINHLFLDPAGWVDITPLSFEFHYPQHVLFQSGITWTTSHTYDVTTNTWNPLPLTTVGSHVNDGAMTFDPDDPLVVFAASDIGIAVSEDGASTFEERNDGLEGVNIYDVDVDMITKDVALVASKSGVAITSVFQLPPTPADWQYPVFPQGTGGAPLTASSIVHGSTQEFIIGDSSGRLYLSQNGGATWTETYNYTGAPIQSRSSSTDIDSVPGTDVLYAGIGFGEFGDTGTVVRSDDRGQTWNATTLTGVHPNTLEVVGTNLIYVGVGHELDLPSPTNEGIHVSNDGGVTWHQVALTSGPFKGLVTELAQDPVTPTVQYAAVNHGPGNGTVMRFEYDLTGLVTLSAVDLCLTYGGPTNGRFTALDTNDLGTEVYVAVDEDIFLFDVPTSTWSFYSAGLPGETIYALYWDDLVVCTSTGFYTFEPTSGIGFWRDY